MDLPDIELLQAWRAEGNRESLELLITRHLGRIHRLMTRMVSQSATADDLTQEVFLRVARRLDAFSAEAEFSTWLYRIALNVAYSHLAGHDCRRMEPWDDQQIPLVPASDGPTERLVTVERMAAIERAVQALPPKRRAALVLVCLEEKSIEEVAAIEGCPPQTIYSRLHEARRQLKSQLKDLLS